ncbi:MAG TPA: extracellular solute-binding protein, partial [Thermosynechococcaceae cyanobacterium]
MPYSRRRFLQASSAATAGVSVSGCGWTLAEVRSASGSGATDQLNIYTWSNYIDDALLQSFTAQTGIRVVKDTFDSNETMLATFQAGKGAAYSVIYPSDYTVAKMLELKLLQPLDRSRIIGLENILPRFQNSVHDPGNRYHVPLSWGTTGLVYNSEKLQTPPDDWNYLWQNQQQLSRRMTLLSDTREVIGASLRSLGFSYNSTNPSEIQQAYEKLRNLKPAIASFTTDAWRDQILAGDLLVSMAFSVDGVLVTRQNPKLKYVVPRSGSSVWSDTIVIPKTAPNPTAAYAWINFMLQPAIASQVTERLLFATPNQAAYDQLPSPLRNNEVLFPPQAIVEKCEGIRPVAQDLTELYEK